MLGQPRRAAAGTRRRTGPVGEQQWWDPADQAFVERPIITRSTLGKGWRAMPMVNNTEQLDPYGDDPHSEALRAARLQRGLTALDEGAAWRHRREGALVVLRAEVFATADDTAHRAAWRDHATGALGSVWRERWRERDREPGWIEARWRHEPDRPTPFGPVGGDAAGEQARCVDWLVVEDQTGTAATEVVTLYQHVTVWADRALATVIVRHDQRLDVDDATSRGVAAVLARLQTLDG